MAETREEWIRNVHTPSGKKRDIRQGEIPSIGNRHDTSATALEGSAASSDGKEVKPKTKRSVTGSKTNGVVTPAPKRTASRKTAS